MKSWLLLFSAYSFLTALSCGPTLSNTPKEINFMNSQIVFASLDESKDLLGTSDEFTKSLSPFDCASKTQNTENKQESDYLEFAKNQALQWTAKDIVNTTKIIEETIHQIQKLQLEIPLPEKIILVKSTCLEEGGASGYTRGSFIVLNSAPDIHLFIHELFHVFSRHNPEIRERLYATIGFKPCNKIDYPESLIPFKITNPDAPFFNHYINVNTKDGAYEAVIITKASKPYEGGSFFEYLEINMLALDDVYGIKYVLKRNGEPVILKFSEIVDFTTQVGNNTGYIIHPEEILAEHFSMALIESEVKEPIYIQKVLEVLQK